MKSENISRKFIETIDLDEWEVDTDTGWADIESIGKTVKYQVYSICTTSFNIGCADDHIFFNSKMNEVYAKELKVNDLIQTKNGLEPVISININEDFEQMFDLKLSINSNHRYFTNGILSHNSIWLANLVANAVKEGFNSAFVSLEMRDNHVVKRIGANLLNISMQEYSKFAEDTDLVKKKLGQVGMDTFKKPGALHIKEYPTSTASTKDIESYLTRMEEIKGIKFKIVFVDYINIMLNWRNPNTENTYMKIKQIAEDLRAMAARNNWAVVTVTQLNRCLTLNTKVETPKGIIEIKDLKVGDLINSPEGFAPVTYVYPTEKQKVYKVKLKSGKTITMSGNHLTPKSNGELFTTLELKVGDKILTKNV